VLYTEARCPFVTYSKQSKFFHQKMIKTLTVGYKDHNQGTAQATVDTMQDRGGSLPGNLDLEDRAPVAPGLDSVARKVCASCPKGVPGRKTTMELCGVTLPTRGTVVSRLSALSASKPSQRSISAALALTVAPRRQRQSINILRYYPRPDQHRQNRPVAVRFEGAIAQTDIVYTLPGVPSKA
jgi:hypothetical protein